MGLLDRSIQALLREIANDQLIVALKGCDQALRDKFFANMSKRAAMGIKEDMDYVISLFPRIGERLSQQGGTMSGGEQQRVAIARALINEPRIVFGDEPTGNLDTARSREIMELLKSFNQESGITIVMVTHSPAHSDYARRTINLFDGQVVTENLRAVV